MDKIKEEKWKKSKWRKLMLDNTEDNVPEDIYYFCRRLFFDGYIVSKNKIKKP